MNDIKFRICYTAQNGEKSIVHESDRFLIGLDGKVYENYGKSWDSAIWEEPFDVEPPILQRFSGCQDRNGKEIYEGDIINYNGRFGTIEFFAGIFVVNWGDQTDDELSYLMINDIAIVGNNFQV